MDRRHFISLLCGTTVNAFAVGPGGSPLHAQSRTHRVGILFPAGDTGFRKLADALRALGYIEGRNVTYEIRAAGLHVERLPELAREGR
jgi:hypothetical protein